MPWRRVVRSGIAAVCATFLVTGVAAGQAPTGGVYPTWTLNGSGASWSGTMDVPATGFPQATYTSNSTGPQLPSGSSIFLGPTTPFGAVFGSSEGQPYLNQRNTTGGLPSTATFTFAAPTPATGWGFALGDVDADQVTIQASGPGGPLTSDALGFQGAFNYCDASPQPPGCDATPFTDVPTWNPATATLIGNVNDTQGAAGWFRPTAPVTSLTFTFTAQSGFPIYQLWFASLDPPVTTTTTTTAPTTTTVASTTTTAPANTTVRSGASDATPPPEPPPPDAHKLPTTGGAPMPLGLVGSILTAAGAACLLLRRRFTTQGPAPHGHG